MRKKKQKLVFQKIFKINSSSQDIKFGNLSELGKDGGCPV